MESPYAPLLRKFKEMLPVAVYREIREMDVTDRWELRIQWYGQDALLIIPLAGNKLGWDELVSAVCLRAP